jgi:U6 snRNA-associated Sm-like protein LSm6
MAEPTSTSAFLASLAGGSVLVKLYSGEEYHGKLDSIDGYMNITLENSTELVNGQQTHKYGDIFIRGNNVLYISQE